MTDFQALQIQPDTGDASLAQQQTRFNALVLEVARARTGLAEWKERIERYEQAVGPVRRQVHDAFRQWVCALDAASLQPAFSRAERRQLGEMLVEAATDLLSVESDDAEMAAVLRRHQEEVAEPEVAPAAPPQDPEEGATPDLSEGEQMAHLAEQWERQAEAAAALREQRAASRRAASARKRQAQDKQAVTQSLRDVYRKLASALHPDREPDAQERERKTGLMQQANQAYEAGNLLALLELQLQAEQVNAARLASLEPQRLQHYVTVLQDQLAELQAETRRLEAEFRLAVGLPPGSGLLARKLDRMISAEVQRTRADLQHLALQTRLLQEVDATKSWLRDLRRG